MPEPTLNLYGDQRVATLAGNGIDVASQRMDGLDALAIARISEMLPVKDVLALDVGCGHGGQTARMAKAGAYVVAMDSFDYRNELAETLAREGVRSGVCIFQRAAVESRPRLGEFDIIVCQRMIHYLENQAALDALDWFRGTSVQGGRLFLSASGLDSELGNNYPARELPVERRFAHLSPEMAEKHSILKPVCLYGLDELSALVIKAGWMVEKAFLSPFGNVKLVARKP